MGQSAAEGTTANAVSAPGPGSSAVNIVIPADQFRPLSFMGIGIIIAIAFAGIAIYIADHSADHALNVANQAQTESRMAEYYAISTEMYLAQHGLTPPPDPWRKHLKEKSK